MSFSNSLLPIPTGPGADLSQFAHEHYHRLYLPQGHFGIFEAHDGMKVFFFLGQFDHAFETSRDRTRRPYAKNVLDPFRIERMPWIGPIIRGKVPETACFNHWQQSVGIGDYNRLYVYFPEMYVVWLDRKRDGEWKFSSAYKATREDIRRYIGSSKRIWSYPKENAP